MRRFKRGRLINDENAVEWRMGCSRQKLEVRDPQDNGLVDTVPLASAEDMRTAIAATVTSFERTRQMPVHGWMTIIRRAVSLISERHLTLARNIAREGMKTNERGRRSQICIKNNET